MGEEGEDVESGETTTGALEGGAAEDTAGNDDSTWSVGDRAAMDDVGTA